MYRHLYGLTHKPFQISTDPAFLWLGGKHREALAVLVYGVRDSRGFLLLSGGVGTGKTTLIRSLLGQLDKNVAVATVQDPGLTPLEFFNFIAAAYGMRRRYTNKVDFLFDFEKFLRKTRDAGRTSLLIVDEAQRLDQTLLEEIRLLSNIEDPDQKLLNVFFVGQEEFLDIISAPENRALKQRITINYHLEPLNAEETEQLVRHRLKVAGASREVFTAEAFPLIHRFSQGAPRLVNILCDHALLTGFVKDRDTIGADIIAECIEDLMLPGEHSRDLPSLPPAETPPSTPAPPRPVAATVTAGMMLQESPPPARRPKWPWAAAAGLLLAIGLGYSVERGWLPLSDPQIIARESPAAVERPAPSAQAPAATAQRASMPSDPGGQAREASAPPGALPEARPTGETPPDRDGVAGEKQAAPEPLPAPAVDRNTPADEEPPIGHELPDPLPPEPAIVEKSMENAVTTAPSEPAAVTIHTPTAARVEKAPQDGKTKESPAAPREDAPATETPASSETQAAQTASVGAPPTSARPGADSARARPSATPKTPTDDGYPASPISGTPTATTKAPPPPPPPAALEKPAPTLPAPPAPSPAAAITPAKPPYPTEDRVRDFIDAYCRAYESLDVDRFRLFFAEDAEESGRPFGALLPVYQRNFAALDELEYTIDLQSWKEDASSGRITLSGNFHVRYRLQDQDWRSTRGAITMDLEPIGSVYQVKRLDYRKE